MLTDNLTVSAAMESAVPTFGRFASVPVTAQMDDLGPSTDPLASYLHALYLSILGRTAKSEPARTLLRACYTTQAARALDCLSRHTDPEAREFALAAQAADYTTTTGLPVGQLLRLAARLEYGKTGDYSLLHLVVAALGDEAHSADDVTVLAPTLDGSLIDSTLGLVSIRSGGTHTMQMAPFWRLMWAIFAHDDAMPLGTGSVDTVLRFVAKMALPLDPFALVAERRHGALEIPFANYVSLLLREQQMFSAETRRMVVFRRTKDVMTLARLRFFGSQDHTIADEGDALGFLTTLYDKGAKADPNGVFFHLGGERLLQWPRRKQSLVLPEDVFVPAYEAITLTDGEPGSEDDPFGTGDDNEPPVDPTGKTEPDPATIGEGEEPDPTADGAEPDAGADDGLGEDGTGDDGMGDPMTGDPSADPNADGGDPANAENNNMSLLIPSAGAGETADDLYYRIAVLNVHKALEADPDSDFDPDKLETLTNVCNNWLFHMDIESVKQLVEELGLTSILRPLVEK